MYKSEKRREDGKRRERWGGTRWRRKNGERLREPKTEGRDGTRKKREGGKRIERENGGGGQSRRWGNDEGGRGGKREAMERRS